MPHNDNRKQPAVNARTRLRAAAVFLCLALAVAGGYFLFGQQEDQQGTAGRRNLAQALTGREPAVFLRVKTDRDGGLAAGAVPETIYVFQNGAVSEWKGTDRGVNLHTLGLGDGRESLAMMDGGCFTDAEFVVDTAQNRTEVCRAGNLLFALAGEPERMQADQLVFSGWRLEDDPDSVILAAGISPEAAQWTEDDHVLMNPSLHEKFAFLQSHAQAPACQGRQEMAAVQEEKDDLEGLKPGVYQAAYDMNLRTSCHKGARVTGSLWTGQEARIELLERAEDGSVWGRIRPGEWVCLRDAEYEYLHPVQEENAVQP